MTTSNKRRFLLFGLFFLILAILPALFIANTPISIERSANGAHIQFGANRQIISRRVCTGVSWNVVGAREVYLNKEKVADTGSSALCGSSSLPVLRVVFADSSGQDFTLPLFFLPTSLVVLIGMGIVGFVVFSATQLRVIGSLSARGKSPPAWLATSARWVYVFLCIALAAVAMTARARLAFGTEKALNWDETYYASITATAAHGFGVYPYIMGYPQMPDYGGVGYYVYLDVVAYNLVGPTILSLRLVSYLASVVTLTGMFVFSRRWYGSAAGLVAVALTPWLWLFQQFSSARPDIIAMAFAIWALVLFQYAIERKQRYWPYLVGFVFAIGLEFHLHTIATAFACGLLYLVETVVAVRQTKSWRTMLRTPVIGFFGGYVLGAILFATLNILPNPQSFFRSASLSRLGAANTAVGTNNLNATMNVPKLIQTFISPKFILPKEAYRYYYLFESISPWETLLWIMAIPMFFLMRQNPNDRRTKWLIVGGMVGGGIIFNAPNILYLAPILPIFIIVLTPLFTHGFGSDERVSWGSISVGSCVALLAIGTVFLLSSLSQFYEPADELAPEKEAADLEQQIEQVRTHASTDCVIAGPSELYVHYFMKYPKFIGTRLEEVQFGSNYYNLTSDLLRYWGIKQPDLIFGPLLNDLDKYVAAAQYTEVAEGIWQKPSELSRGCIIEIR